MSKHVFGGLSAILIAMILMIFTSVSVPAFDARAGGTITVASGEVVDDDLYVGAGTVTIDGTINGDLWAAGSKIIVNGIVTGSVMAVGQTIDINGDVGHVVRVAGTTISIRGNVDGDLMVAGGDVNIASTAEVKGDVLLGAGNVRIDGLIEGDIKGGGGEVTISNGVEGDVELKVESLTILSTADIGGDLSYTSEDKADIRSGAQIDGVTTHKLPRVKEEPSIPFPFALFSGIVKIIGFLMALITGLVIILIAPRRLTSIAEAIRSRPGPSAGWGAMILFLTPIAAIIVCLTIVGIPVGLIALALWGIAIYLAQIPVGLLIGRLILGRFRAVEGKAIMVGALALGLLILKLLGLIPYVGFFIGLAIAIFGLGAGVALIRMRRAGAEDETSA
ncbi:polymer-forming cytoskeletal protein [Candidatus Bathyarchaeota archaeon]|nr:polymer-forming cytoskeletal protein [Candidatus Bathyarchaeota archaeon]